MLQCFNDLKMLMCTKSCLCFSDTFGIESVVITDTTGGRVCLECSFSSFSTDTGCTVELVSSDSSSSVQYTETINRSGNSLAEGCVSGVTAGEYIVRVYDQSSSKLVYKSENVTVLLLLPLSTPMMSSSFARAEIMVSETASKINEDSFFFW